MNIKKISDVLTGLAIGYYVYTDKGKQEVKDGIGLAYRTTKDVAKKVYAEFNEAIQYASPDDVIVEVVGDSTVAHPDSKEESIIEEFISEN